MKKIESSAIQGDNRVLPLRDLDTFVIALILIKEFLLDFFGVGNAVNFLIIVLIAVALVKSGRVPSGRVLFPFFAALFLMIASFVAYGGEWGIALKNALRIVQLFPYVFFIGHLFADRWELLKRIGPALLLLCNIILIINIIVMAVQYYRPGVIVAWDSGPELYGPDVICGLFGKGSTHAVAMLSSFVVVNNAVYARRKRPRGGSMYNVMMLIASLAVALINDNKALFLLLPLYIFCFGVIYLGLSRRRGNSRKVIRSCIVVIAALGLAVVFSYMMFDWFKRIVDSTIISSLEMILNSLSGDAYVNGSNERFKQIGYALSIASSWLFGEGIGITDFYQEGYHGFSFFGQSDYGSMIIICGVWLYLAVIAFYTSALSDAVGPEGMTRSNLIIVVVVMLLVMSVYSQIFTQVRFGIPFLMMAASLEFYAKYRGVEE